MVKLAYKPPSLIVEVGMGINKAANPLREGNEQFLGQDEEQVEVQDVPEPEQDESLPDQDVPPPEQVRLYFIRVPSFLRRAPEDCMTFKVTRFSEDTQIALSTEVEANIVEKIEFGLVTEEVASVGLVY